MKRGWEAGCQQEKVFLTLFRWDRRRYEPTTQTLTAEPKNQQHHVLQLLSRPFSRIKHTNDLKHALHASSSQSGETTTLQIVWSDADITIFSFTRPWPQIPHVLSLAKCLCQ